MRCSRRANFPPPVDDIDEHLSAIEQAPVARMLECSIVGGPESLRRGLDEIMARTQADELIVATHIFAREDRFRSFELLAAAAKHS